MFTFNFNFIGNNHTNSLYSKSVIRGPSETTSSKILSKYLPQFEITCIKQLKRRYPNVQCNGSYCKITKFLKGLSIICSYSGLHRILRWTNTHNKRTNSKIQQVTDKK